jgi:pyruvate/2-oxoglutarate dehydrogenase complex dihydrolipoamide acyltransferase (E2) component
MKKLQKNYQEVSFPKIRRVFGLTLASVQRKPMMHGLLEVDVSKAREFLRAHKARTGESLSFTAFIISCVAHAVDEHKALHACRKGSKHLALFEEVDVATMIERDVAGQKLPITLIIRAANTKTFREIHQEIRAAQAKSLETTGATFTSMQRFLFLPMVFFRGFWWAFSWLRRTFPKVQKKYQGTVGVSAVGMFGQGGGWGIPLNDLTLGVTLGGIAQKPGVVDGHIAIREYLSLTLSFDHSIVDGAPAARFARRLKELIESGYGLPDFTEEMEQAGAEAAPHLM